jgi:hypothetical protein
MLRQKPRYWSNMPGTFSIELEFGLPPFVHGIRNMIFESLTGIARDCYQRLRDRFSEPEEPQELVIHFLDTGYYDPGKRWNRPEDCYPPEGENDRLFDYATLDGKPIDHLTGMSIFVSLKDQIDLVPVNENRETEYIEFI